MILDTLSDVLLSPSMLFHFNSFLVDVINFTDFTRLSGSRPESIFPPASMYSGRSVLSLMVTHGLPKYNASSGTVPESVIMQKAFFFKV